MLFRNLMEKSMPNDFLDDKQSDDKAQDQNTPDATPVNDEPNTPEQDDKPADEPVSPVEKAIDSLGIPQEDGEENKAKEKEEPEKSEPKAPQKPMTPEDEEAEALASVKSERGKERLQAMLSERKEVKTKLGDLQNYVRESGLDEEGFTSLMALARMVNSPDIEQRKQGLKAIETVRAELYKTIGMEAPGVDLLKDHADLKEKVDALEMTREDALTIANARAFQKKQQEIQAQQAALVQQRQALQTYGQMAIQAFQSRANDPGFDQKVQLIERYFANQDNLARFVRTHAPETWGEALMFMYDSLNVGTAQQPRSNTPTPITQNRTRSMGTRERGAQSNPQGIANLIDELGL